MKKAICLKYMQGHTTLAMLLLGLFLALNCPLASQTLPQGLNYQTVVRDAASNLLAPYQEVGFRFTILESINPGQPIYRETQTLFTNPFGLCTSIIGWGSPDLSAFPNVNWKTGTKYMQVEISVDGTSNFINEGVEQYLSIPYAQLADYAINTGNVNGDSSAVAKFISSKTIGNSLIYDAGANVGIATPAPNSSAQLEISSNNKGFLPPRLSTAQATAIQSPATGLIIYNTTIHKPQYFNGLAWKNFDGT